VVGEAATGPERSSERSSSSPTYHLPRANGIEATRRIVESSPHVGVLVLTIFDDDSGWPLR
jgi:DNA-binding NarL/FixJ family response regulator